jgi:hypothetical protein
MDESGRNPWMQPLPEWLGVSHPAIQQDLDDMLEAIADTYFALVSKYVREFTPHHLVFGPATLHDSKPQILRSAARHIDVLQVTISAYPAHQLADFKSFLDRITTHFDKPFFLWTTFTSQADSPYSDRPNAWGRFDNRTQRLRGDAYASHLSRLLRYMSPQGALPIVGIDWWAWTDHPGEGTNFGLVTLNDNAYDGREAVTAAGTDSWGYSVGRERRDYGDALTHIHAANLTSQRTIYADVKRLGLSQ